MHLDLRRNRALERAQSGDVFSLGLTEHLPLSGHSAGQDRDEEREHRKARYGETAHGSTSITGDAQHPCQSVAAATPGVSGCRRVGSRNPPEQGRIFGGITGRVRASSCGCQ